MNKETLKKLKRRLFKGALYFGGAVVGFAVLSFLAAEYTSRPKFCISCHIMQPYFASWQESKHGTKNIACVECHISPGVTYEIKAKYQALGMVAKYFTQTYGSKPWAEVSDSACLREGCHQTRLLKGKVQFGKVTFDHTPHLTQMRRGLQLRCTSCHSQIVQGKHITVTPSTCVLCHFKGMQHNKSINACTSCHSAPTKTIEFQGIKFDHKDVLSKGINCERCHVDVVVGDGGVPKQRCFTCHNQPWKLDKFNDTVLIHENHVSKHQINCMNCHQEIEHKINKMTDSIAIECNTCHPKHHTAQREMYMGVGGKGHTANKADPMFQAMVSCSGCHNQPHGDEVTNMTMKAGDQSCTACHGDQYRSILAGWKSRLDQLVLQITPILQKAKVEAGKNKEAGELLKQAEYNLRFVEYGKGVHNIQYAQELLQTTQTQIKDALKISRSPFQPAYVTVAPAGKNKECYNCHLGVENVVQSFGKLTFPHGPHLQKANLDCTQCHKNDDKKHGQIIVKTADCKSCHHAQKDAKCETCHSLEANLYAGKVTVANIKPVANSMAKSVPCEGCHVDLAKGSSVEKMKKACVDCHDKNFADMADGWQQNTVDGIKDIDKLNVTIAKLKFKKPEQLQMLAEAKDMTVLLKSDKSKGAHSMEFSDNLITEVKKRLAQLSKEAADTKASSKNVK